MPFFRFVLISCAIFSVGSAAAGIRFGRLWRAKAVAKACQPDLAPDRSLEHGYLNMLRPHRVHVGGVMVDRTAVAEWRTEAFKRMTYEIFGTGDQRAEQIVKVAEAAVAFLRWKGTLAEARLIWSPAGNLMLDLPVGVPSAVFLLTLEQRLNGWAEAVADLTGSERTQVRRWLMKQSPGLEALSTPPPPREAAADTVTTQREIEDRALPDELLAEPRVYGARVFFGWLGPWVLDGDEWVATKGRVRVRLSLTKNLVSFETDGRGELDLASAEEIAWVMVRYDEPLDDLVLETNGDGLRVTLPFDRRGLRALSLMRARVLGGYRQPLRFKWPYISDAQAAAYERWRHRQKTDEVAFPRDAAE